METAIKVCPKCMSDTVVVKERGVGPGVKLMVSGIGFGMRSTDDWVTHLCTTCGYFENYLTKRDWLEKIQANPSQAGWRKPE
jgi:hypothetical protein